MCSDNGAMIYQTPYSWCSPVHIPRENLLGVFESGLVRPQASPNELISGAIAHPVGTPRLRELAKSADQVLIISDDNTRATPVHKIVPHVLSELAEAGVPDSNVRFMIASGTHRDMTLAEKIAKLGPDAVARFPVLDHRYDDNGSLYFLGESRDPAIEIWPNRAVAEATIIIGVGIIIPHGVAGFSGGGKIITPGVCGERTNGDMHWAMVDRSPEEIFGVHDTPVRRIINEVAGRVGLSFIVNVVMNSFDEVVHCVAGHFGTAHEEGARLSAAVHGAVMPERADIVIIDSCGCDIEYWQAIKAMTPGGIAMNDGGVVIHVCDCPEGVSKAHPEVLEFGYVPEKEVLALERGGRISKSVAVHMVQASRVITDRGRGIIVTRGIAGDDCRRLGFTPAPDLPEALRMAFELLGRDATVAALRHAGDILPTIQNRFSKPVLSRREAR